MKAISTLVLFLFFSSAHAAPSVGGGFKPTGINGSAGVGIVTFSILQPENTNFRLDQGVFAAVTGERGFGALGLYLNLTLGYLTTNGQTNYNYTKLSGEEYQKTAAKTKLDIFQGGLGLKIKLIEDYWFRPYVEGGGLGGFFTLKYTESKTQFTCVNCVNSDPKLEDSLLDFGWYGEGGIEIVFSNSFGLRVAGRLIESETKDLETLANKKVRYKATAFYLSLLKSF